MLYNLFENRDFVSVFAVALLAEGVDRNHFSGLDLCFVAASPSSRRAWIEIEMFRRTTHKRGVALLAEGVDRNGIGAAVFRLNRRSPSSRRAWIEM